MDYEEVEDIINEESSSDVNIAKSFSSELSTDEKIDNQKTNMKLESEDNIYSTSTIYYNK